MLYYIYFSLLSRLSGPKLRAGFYFPYYLDRFRGDYIANWRWLHERYGEIVRISPDNVSIISTEAWRGNLVCKTA